LMKNRVWLDKLHHQSVVWIRMSLKRQGTLIFHVFILVFSWPNRRLQEWDLYNNRSFPHFEMEKNRSYHGLYFGR
jgi:hypothetical protein